jgi:multidrug efflux pump subunit AcrB
MPAGTLKIGESEYDVRTNGTPRTVDQIGNLPIRQVPGTTIYLRDLASVSDSFQVHTNIVRQDGRRGVLITVLKRNASTLDVVKGIRRLLPRVASISPTNLCMVPLAEQSIFVRAAVTGVIREAVIAAALTGLMILLFLGSWRSTLIIAVSIPLSILRSVIVLGFLGETINTMTLGGLALAVGILVDDATVTIENIERFLEEGHDLRNAILEGASQISVPALVSTLCICLVFLPMFFLGGVARYLFVPLAEAVVFAMLASYILSRTLVPTLARYLLRVKTHLPDDPERTAMRKHADRRIKSPLVLFQQSFNRAFETLRARYHRALEHLLAHRRIFIPLFLAPCLCAFLLVPWLGQDFFPSTDSGQFILHVRAPSGRRIEETARLCDLVETYIRRQIPAAELDNVLDNIGLPYSTLNTQHLTNGMLGAGDADVMVSLKEPHRPTADYIRTLRTKLPRIFPGATFYFLPADITTQVLNFGLPAPLDIQFEGNDVNKSYDLANAMLAKLRRVPGLTDVRVQQPFDYPRLDIAVDRTKASQGGFTERDVTTSVLNSLSGSLQVTPMFFLNWENGVNYNLVAQTPQYKMDAIQDQPNDQPLRGDWWAMFKDPELNALETQVDTANQTLKAAEANYRAARGAILFSRAS